MVFKFQLRTSKDSLAKKVDLNDEQIFIWEIGDIYRQFSCHVSLGNNNKQMEWIVKEI